MRFFVSLVIAMSFYAFPVYALDCSSSSPFSICKLSKNFTYTDAIQGLAYVVGALIIFGVFLFAVSKIISVAAGVWEEFELSYYRKSIESERARQEIESGGNWSNEDTGDVWGAYQSSPTYEDYTRAVNYSWESELSRNYSSDYDDWRD